MFLGLQAAKNTLNMRKEAAPDTLSDKSYCGSLSENEGHTTKSLALLFCPEVEHCSPHCPGFPARYIPEATKPTDLYQRVLRRLPGWKTFAYVRDDFQATGEVEDLGLALFSMIVRASFL